MAWSWFRMLPSAFHWLPFPSLKIQHAYVIEISSGKTRSTVPSEHVHIWADEGYRVSSPKKCWNYYRLWWYLSQYYTENSTENSFDSNNSSKKNANNFLWLYSISATYFFPHLGVGTSGQLRLKTSSPSGLVSVTPAIICYYHKISKMQLQQSSQVFSTISIRFDIFSNKISLVKYGRNKLSQVRIGQDWNGDNLHAAGSIHR